jgi:hypothetical protein
MPLGGTYAVTAVRYGTEANARQENVLWWRPSGVISVSDGQAAADQLASKMHDNISPTLIGILATDVFYVGIYVEVSIGGVVFTSRFNDTPIPGTNDGVTSPESVAVVIRKRTSQPGKTGRGRWYIGCVPEDYSSIGILQSGAITAYTSLASAYRGDQVTVLATWGSYHHSGKDMALYSISSTSVEPFLKTERRRLVRSF